MKKNYTYFEAYERETAGVWYFVPSAGTFVKGKPCKGFGCIKYAEGSVYTGEIYYDGKKFNKLGFGRQDFSRSTIGAVMPDLGERKYKYVGNYDYRKTQWIYGNGVVYYTDADGKPTHFRKGFYSGLDKTGEYKGEFDYSALLDGYTPDMEFDYDENAGWLQSRWEEISEKIEKVGKAKALFIGDSYFGLADYSSDFVSADAFKNKFPENYVNIGIGGSKYADWVGWFDKIKHISAPEKIVLNLGFNDLHNGGSVSKVYSDYVKLIKLIKANFPETEIYAICVVHCPNCADFIELENQFNGKLFETADKYKVKIYDWNGIIAQSEVNCFHADAIHPNEYGYGLFAEFIKKFTE